MTKIAAKQFILQKYTNFKDPVNLDLSSPDCNFKLITKVYDTQDDSLLKEGEVLVETIYLSNDPAQKGWYTPYKSYVPPVPLGSVTPAQAIAKVIKSNANDLKSGDYVTGRLIGWSTYNVVDTKREKVSKLNVRAVPNVVKYLSAFGGTTLTSYFTAFVYSGVKRDDEGKVWLITGAAGGAGSALVVIVSSLFKPKKIIAVAGGEEKRKWVETLGDRVIGLDYKSKQYKHDLRTVLGKDEVDVFADHVGGWILEQSVPSMRDHGKIVQIGAIAAYNDDSKNVFSTYPAVITKRLTIQGMVLTDHKKEYGKAVSDLMIWFSSGELDINKFEETIVQAQGEDFKNVPQIWTGLFSGKNRGKFITQIGDFTVPSKL